MRQWTIVSRSPDRSTHGVEGAQFVVGAEGPSSAAALDQGALTAVGTGRRYRGSLIGVVVIGVVTAPAMLGGPIRCAAVGLPGLVPKRAEQSGPHEGDRRKRP